jgi:septal ring factor EnvC (AmiA/AmiB activator)
MAARAYRLLSLVLASIFADSSASVSDAAIHANPIRKVVNLLQLMQKKVTAEGEKEKALFDKFMCYCKTGAGALDQSIGDAENKIPQVQSTINEGAAQKAQLETELKQAQTDREDAKDAIAKATSIREKEAAAFSKESGELNANIKALQGAIAAISKGMSGGFLQTNTAAIVRKIAMNGPNMEDSDREVLLSFLSGEQIVGYAPKSGEITGILKQLEDDMAKNVADITSDESEAKASYGELMTAKSKQIQSLTKAIEVKSKRVGDLSVEIAMMRNDLEDTKEALGEDKKFLADLQKNCGTKEDEWADIQKMRATELIAIADTIKILNDDDALELFKKTLPGPSGFIQVAVSDKAVRMHALEIVRKQNAHHPSVSLGFVQAALQQKAMGFDKVIKMVDDMLAVLKKEQKDDDDKKEYCTAQLDETEDKKKGLDNSLKDIQTQMEDAEEGIASLKSEIASLGAGIKSLDKSVADATDQRQQENEDFTELLSSDNSAKQILEFAKNRLNKFYNPKLYKPAPKRSLEFLSEPLSFAQVKEHSVAYYSVFEAPAPPPEAPGPFKKKTEESGGVIAMIDLLIKDLDKEMQEAEVVEKDSQKAYVSMMADAKAKRAEDAKMITAKESSKAQLEGELETSKDSKASATKELMATLEYMSSLHQDCDWLLKNFEVRKEARASEAEALTKAKAVLSGADYNAALLQKSRFLERS